jgi:RNA polymerase sigma-70 factor (ECF subfamily)
MDNLPEVEDPDKVDSLYDFKETKERLYAMVRELSPEKAAAFTLIKEEEFSYKEASQILGVPVSTLEKQVSGSLKHLRKALIILLILAS